MTDSIVTPENTKKIAEWMGQKAIIFDDMVLISSPAGQIYNPITNAEQSREIEKKLLVTNWIIGINPENNTWRISVIAYKNKRKFVEMTLEAETLELALYKAALFEVEK